MNNEKKLSSRIHNFSDWYNELVFQAELADHAPVRGCIVVRPYGYAVWELMQKELDARMKAIGVQNAAFSLLIPQSFIAREADHIEGFAPELAIVTQAGGKKLEEPLVVRPTSETVIHHSFAQWIRSWRDLPLKINQWCSVVRWEKRPRPFIRTTEFWWQECHTAHATREEAEAHAHEAWQLYADFFKEVLALPVIQGAEKPAHERFAGALKTLTLECMMGDGKACQMGTSHLLSPTFAQAFDVKFQDQDGSLQSPYFTSWGVTTRMIGGVIMVHGDDKGLVFPYLIAPIQIVIVPIIGKENRDNILLKIEEIKERLIESGYRVHLDDREVKPGAKYYHWELKGAPLRLEIGPRDLENNVITASTRDDGKKHTIPINDIMHNAKKTLNDLFKEQHRRMYEKAERHLLENTKSEEKLDRFGPLLSKNNGFYRTGWCGEASSIEAFKFYQATIRCALPEKTHTACCVHENCASRYDIIVAKAY